MTNTVIFDLDGTLLDTAHDFAHTINLMLAEKGLNPVNYEDFRAKACVESNHMIAYAFNINPNDAEFETLRQSFLNRYRDNCTVNTRFFEGVTTLLNYLDTKKIPWGIMTNKPGWLTDPVIKHFELDKRAKCIISGDTLLTRKPSPEPLLHACELIGETPDNAVYVGDLETDIIAARAAKMKSIAVSYGYHPTDTNQQDWQPDFIAQKPLDIVRWLAL